MRCIAITLRLIDVNQLEARKKQLLDEAEVGAI